MWEAKGLWSGEYVDMMFYWLMAFCDSCHQQDWGVLDVHVTLLLCCLLEAQAEQPDGHKLWDLEWVEEAQPVLLMHQFRELVDAALCFPLGLKKLRKSSLDSVLSLVSSGSTCFLTLDLFFFFFLSRGNHLHMSLADNDFLPNSYVLDP